MPATGFHKATGKYLTGFGKNAKAGDIHTISIGSTSKLHRYGQRRHDDNLGEPKTCEFTTYLLCEPEAADEWGPLFDLKACSRVCPLDYDGQPSADQLRQIAAMPDLERFLVREAAQ